MSGKSGSAATRPRPDVDRLLADAAMDLVRAGSRDEIFDIAADFLEQACPGSVIVINQIVPGKAEYVTRKLTGVGSSVMRSAARLTGMRLVGQTWPIPDAFAEKLRSAEFTHIPEGFAALAAPLIPPEVAKALTSTFGLRELYAVGIADTDHALGNFAILTRDDDAHVPATAVESFARHCYSALARLEQEAEAERELARTQALLGSMSQGLALCRIVTDEHGKAVDYVFLEMNAAFAKLGGLDPEAAIGRSARELAAGRGHLLEHIGSHIDIFGRVAKTGVPESFEEHDTATDRYFTTMVFSPQRGEFAALVTETTEQSRATVELAASEERLSLLFRQAPLGYQSLDEEGCFVEINDAWLELLGYERDEVIGRWFGDFLAPEYVEAFRQRFPLFKEFGVIHSEFQMMSKQGERRFIAFDGRIGHNPDGSFRQTHCILADITERSRAEAALHASEERHRTSIQTAMDGFLLSDQDQRILEVNRAYVEMSGYSEEELLGMRIAELEAGVSPGEIDLVQREAAETGHARLESMHRRKDGSTYDVEVSIAHIESQGGRYSAFVRDITQRKQAEADLAESRARLQAILDNTPALIYAKDREGHFTLANERIARLFEMSTDEVVGKTTADLVHVSVADDHAANDRTVFETGEPLTVEEVNEEPSGRRTYLSVKFPLRDIHGEVTAVGGISTDVTDLKDAESAARERQEFIEAILANSPIGFGVNRIDDGAVVLISDNFERIYCVEPHTIEGVGDFFDKVYRDPAVREQMRTRIMEDLSSGDPDRMIWEDVPLVDADGRTHYVTASNIPVGDQNLMISAVQDVTDRVIAQQEAARQQERAARMMNAAIDIASSIVETRDPYTAGHQERTTRIAVEVATMLGMPESEVADVRVASLIHDVGKMLIPADVLSRPGKLSVAEFALVQEHAEAGYRTAVKAQMDESIARMIHEHHERLDGTGYPRGLHDDEISLGARVIAVADVVESMMSHRPYRPALGLDAALAEIERGSGTKYDTRVVSACVELFRERGFEL